jgi:cell division protein FtsQ
MADRRIIRKGLQLAGWTILSGGILFLLIAAMNARTTIPCTAVDIRFSDPKGERYISRATISGLLDRSGVEGLKGRSVAEMDLLAMEKRLESDPWIRNAELFIDGKHVLHVTIFAQEPVARLFTTSGDSFYIDSSLHRIPLNERHTPRLPVFTSLPLGKHPWSRKDSLMLSEVREIVDHLMADSFWLAQIEQCDFDPQHGFTMVPKFGEHRIIFGKGSEVDEKFHKLMVFYRQVLSRTGWNSYASLDLRFSGQLVAIPAGADPLLGDSAVQKFDKGGRPGLVVHDDVRTGTAESPAKEVSPKKSAIGAGEIKVGKEQKPKAVMPSSAKKT